jgi:S-(hydroxymethyl)glutathione dehydrogenase/alcohol dehydrogenase
VAEMRALVLRDVESGPELVGVRVDDPGPGEVLVRVEASGICGSDLHFLHGRSNVNFLPAIVGHEGAGTVAEVGPGVTGLSPGDRVVVAMSSACGACEPCARGDLHLCNAPERTQQIQGRMADGASRFHLGGSSDSGDSSDEVFPFVGCGTVAEYVVASERRLVKVPDGVPIEAAAVAACGVLTGIGAVFNIARPPAGSTALVIGCGGVGLSVIQGCRISGASRIVAVDTNPARLDAAKRVGATDVIDASHASSGAGGSVPEAVRSLVPQGLDYSYEVVGQPDLVPVAFGALRPGGTCVAVASYPPGSTISVAAGDLFWDRRLRGCIAGNSVARHDLPRIFDLYLTGALDLEPLTARKWRLDEVHDAIAASERGEVPRAVVTFEGA